MLILAVDTTSAAGGAAIYREGQCLASVDNEGPANIYSTTLFQMIDRLIAEVSAATSPPLRALAEIELFAVANGPGSFTGIRVGLAAVQAWAKVFGRPARGVSVLEALVEAARPETEIAVPVLDAHRGEFYFAAFRRTTSLEDPRFVAEGEGRVARPETVKEFIATWLGTGQGATCLVREHDQAARALVATLGASLRWRSVRGTLLPAIARLGYRAAREGTLPSPSELDAYYIRRSDAELKWKE